MSVRGGVRCDTLHLDVIRAFKEEVIEVTIFAPKMILMSLQDLYK